MNNVDHPAHYNVKGKKECIDEMVDDFGLEMAISFCLTNAYKYLYRAGEKQNNPKEQDIAKAKWYYEWVKKKYSDIPSLFSKTETNNWLALRKAYVYIKERLEGERFV